jgi:phosphoribosylglycinamide formyltransferase-1
VKNIAVFASGSGSNAENLSHFFKNHPEGRVALIVCNNPKAGVLERAKKLGIPIHITPKNPAENTTELIEILLLKNIDFIVLAGFLRKIPNEVLAHYEDRIINIHPALLPAFGGKGMYGMRIHEAVMASGARESGITIHKVSENYDEGSIIFQSKCAINPNDTAETLAKKIHQLEYKHFPEVVEACLKVL